MKEGGSLTMAMATTEEGGRDPSCDDNEVGSAGCLQLLMGVRTLICLDVQ